MLIFRATYPREALEHRHEWFASEAAAQAACAHVPEADYEALDVSLDHKNALVSLLNLHACRSVVPNAPDAFSSVLQPWVEALPIRQQGVAILALRGPDGMRKESAAKPVIRALRACVLNSGRHGVPMGLGESFDGDRFMSMALISSTQAWDEVMKDFFASIDEFNLHFFQHLIHAAAVVGFAHPIPQVRNHWLAFYHKACEKLHVTPETQTAFAHRLRNGNRGKGDE